MSAAADTAQRLRAAGWAGLDFAAPAINDQARQMREKMVAEADMLARFFDTPDGRRVLDMLVVATILRPPGPAEQAAQTAEQYAIAKARREGEASVVHMILAAIDSRARGQAALPQQT